MSEQFDYTKTGWYALLDLLFKAISAIAVVALGVVGFRWQANVHSQQQAEQRQRDQAAALMVTLQGLTELELLFGDAEQHFDNTYSDKNGPECVRELSRELQTMADSLFLPAFVVIKAQLVTYPQHKGLFPFGGFPQEKPAEIPFRECTMMLGDMTGLVASWWGRDHLGMSIPDEGEMVHVFPDGSVNQSAFPRWAFFQVDLTSGRYGGGPGTGTGQIEPWTMPAWRLSFGVPENEKIAEFPPYILKYNVERWYGEMRRSCQHAIHQLIATNPNIGQEYSEYRNHLIEQTSGRFSLWRRAVANQRRTADDLKSAEGLRPTSGPDNPREVQLKYLEWKKANNYSPHKPKT